MNATTLSPYSRRRFALLFGALGLLVFVAFLWWSFAGAGLFTFGKGTIEFVFTDGLNVVPRSSEVRVDGLEVGKVTDVSVVVIDGEDKVVVTANLDDDVDLRADASAELALKSLLGEKMVNLEPGSSSAPLKGRRITETAVGTDITTLSSGGPDSAALYDGFGHDAVFEGLDAASGVTPEATSETRRQIAEVRALTDRLVAGQPDLLTSIGNIEALTDALVDATGEIGSLIDTKRIVEARLEETIESARADWVRMEAAVRIVDAVMRGHEADLAETARAFEASWPVTKEALRLWQSGRMIPTNILGLGTLLDKDVRQPGPNPQIPAPLGPLPSEEELEAE
jgi:virulence factor Mce-like protein